MKACRPVLASAVLVLGLAALLGAQAAPDDVIVANSNQTYLLKVDPKGVVKTFAVPGFGAQSITEDLFNRGVVIASGRLPGDLVQLDLNGVATTVLAGGPMFVDLDVDGEGNYLGAGFVPGGKTSAVFTVSPSGSYTTLISGSPPFGKVYAMALDTLTGDVIVVDGGGFVLQITRDPNPVVTTIVGSITTGGNAGIHPLFGGAGQLIGFWNVTAYRLIPGAPTPLTPLKSGSPFIWSGDVEYEASSGLYLLADMGTSQGSIYKFDAATSAVTTLVNMSGERPFMLAVAGGRHLSAVGPARVGQTLQLKVSMPSQAGDLYVTALSFGYAPGFVLPGGVRVYLNPDPLLFLSLSGVPMFTQFQGLLSPQGEAGPAVALPGVPALAGVRVFAAAVAFHGGNAVRSSEPLGITIRP